MRRRLAAIAVAASLCAAVAAPRTAHAIAAGVAGTLSVVPGLGQVATGNVLEGLGWFGATVGTWFLSPGLAWEFEQYNLYDAYRDAKPSNRRYADHTWYENYIAVFNPLNFFDPIGAPLLVGYGAIPGWTRHHGSNLYPLKALSTSFIGPAEEGLFRGFLFPGISDLTHSTVVGALASSAVFGLVHVQYDWTGKAVVAALGLVECLQVHLNNYDLRKNSFAHSWIDFFLLPTGEGPLEGRPSGATMVPGMRFNLAF
jgi:membrane protease YdiL (CAAX protease family)